MFKIYWEFIKKFIINLWLKIILIWFEAICSSNTHKIKIVTINWLLLIIIYILLNFSSMIYTYFFNFYTYKKIIQCWNK